MAEAASEKLIASIPRFTLPAEFSNDKPAAAPAAPEATPAEAPKEPETAAPEASAATPPETPKETTEEQGKETTEKVPARLQKRIDRATRLRYEAEQRAAQFERELTEAKSKPPVDPSEPKMADFSDIAEYGKAMREYGEKKTAKEVAEKQTQERNRKFTQDLTSQWASQAAKGEVEFDDFEEVVGDLKPTSPWAVALMQEENGYKIAHYLGTHPREAEKIISLDPYAQVREISKLSIKLQAPPPAQAKPSKAPPPIAPVTGTAEIKKDEIRPNQPFEEYIKVGNKLFRGRP